MEEKLPDNLEEALEYIQKLQSENAKLKETVDKQNIMLSNLNEMLVKGRKAMFGMFLSSKIVTISPKKIKPYVSAKG